MSESLAQQNPRSPFRRAPSMVRQQSRVGRTGSVSSGAFEQQTDDLLQLARTNIQKLREKEEKKVTVTQHLPDIQQIITVNNTFILRLYTILSLIPVARD